MKVNMVAWFEIPVLDMERAKKFYEEVFQVRIAIHDMGGLIMGWFPPAENPEAPGATGSLVQHEKYVPSDTKGPVLYFNTQSGDIANELARVVPAGGKVLQEKTLISENVGYMGVFLDTEGNRLAIYSR